MLSAAVEDGLLLVNPAFGIGRKMMLGKSRDEDEGDVKPFTIDQLARFLDEAARTDPRYPVFALMAFAKLAPARAALAAAGGDSEEGAPAEAGRLNSSQDRVEPWAFAQESAAEHVNAL
jgi:hypothetical protein